MQRGKKRFKRLEIPMNPFLKLKHVIEETDELALQLRICMCLLSEMSSGNTDTLQKHHPNSS